MLVLFSALSLAQGSSFAAPSPAPADPCAPYAGSRAKLERIYKQYVSLPKTPANAEKLFLLYQRLQRAGKEVHALYPDYRKHDREYATLSGCLGDSRFQEMGVYIGHYSDRLEFSEKLLAEAHRLNPNTQYRKYTLYAAVLGDTIGADLPDLPDVAQARRYLKEFPEGPYATDVHLILAGFYHDLFMSLRFGEASLGESNSCYVDYVARHPDEADAERARKLAILHFKKVLAALPPASPDREGYELELDALKRGKADNVIHWCTD